MPETQWQKDTSRAESAGFFRADSDGLSLTPTAHWYYPNYQYHFYTTQSEAMTPRSDESSIGVIDGYYRAPSEI